MELIEGKYGHGALAHTHDERDYHYSELGRASTPFDWNVGVDFSPVTIKDQGSSFSCGGQAWSYFMGILKGDNRSAKYIYAQTAAPQGGSDGRTNCDLVANQGDCLEENCVSYENGNPPSEAFITNKADITEAARIDAADDKAFSYAQVSLDFDSIAQAIRDNKGVIIGVDGENNGSWSTAFPVPPQNIVWRHWLLACKAKLINGRKFIGVVNSWGTGVGENGVQWFGEEWLPHIFVAWTLYMRNIPYIFRNTMMYGQTSNDVLNLQRRLGVRPTGFFGPLTKAAVYAYQLKNVNLNWFEKYVLKGNIVGSKTIAALNGS